MTDTNKLVLKSQLKEVVYMYLYYNGECEITEPEADHEATLIAEKAIKGIIKAEEKYQVTEIRD